MGLIVTDRLRMDLPVAWVVWKNLSARTKDPTALCLNMADQMILLVEVLPIPACQILMSSCHYREHLNLAMGKLHQSIETLQKNHSTNFSHHSHFHVTTVDASIVLVESLTNPDVVIHD